jgi:hypothetical protein
LEQEVYSYGLLSDVLPTVHLNRNISDLITGMFNVYDGAYPSKERGTVPKPFLLSSQQRVTFLFV